jgi:hypothetical protein
MLDLQTSLRTDLCSCGVVDQIISRGLAVILALAAAALVALYPLRLPSDRLVATDIAHALPITVMAAAGHAVLGPQAIDELVPTSDPDKP